MANLRTKALSPVAELKVPHFKRKMKVLQRTTIDLQTYLVLFFGSHGFNFNHLSAGEESGLLDSTF